MVLPEHRHSGFRFGHTILLGFIVGIAISGQTFYSFVLENLRHLGALKAMGTSNGLLAACCCCKRSRVGSSAMGWCRSDSVVRMAVIKKGQPPFLLPYQLPLFTLVIILFICAFAGAARHSQGL